MEKVKRLNHSKAYNELYDKFDFEEAEYFGIKHDNSVEGYKCIYANRSNNEDHNFAFRVDYDLRKIMIYINKENLVNEFKEIFDKHYSNKGYTIEYTNDYRYGA